MVLLDSGYYSVMNDDQVKQLNAFSGFLSFIKTEVFEWLLNCVQSYILINTGNQYGKTLMVAMSYVMRIMGWHPIPERNVVYFECENNHKFGPFQVPADRVCPHCNAEVKEHKRERYVFRFCFETQPGQTGGVGDQEVKNAQYPAFKKLLPAFLIKKDITFRNPSMVIANPHSPENDIIVEFVSYSQSTQSTAGQQRMSVWCDEAPTPQFYEEQHARLWAENGDMILTYTPADRTSFLFDELYERAAVYYRTQSICDYMSTANRKYEKIEYTGSGKDIAVIQASSYDNPIFTKEEIEKRIGLIDDPDAVAIRAYGIFKQHTGQIFKDFNYSVHYISKDEHFPEGMVRSWNHARAIDYHQQTPWACIAVAISPQDEAFVWAEMNPSPENFTTQEICSNLSNLTADYRFSLNLVDRLAETVKKDSVSVLDDINREFYNLRREGIGFGGFWQTWDPTGEKGRDEIRMRLKNSLKVGEPFNNVVVNENGVKERVPTIWILDTCPQMAKSLRNWRWDEWASSKDQHTKEAKNKPMQKWSHFCTALECLFKHPSFKARKVSGNLIERKYNYFRMGRRRDINVR